FEPSTALGWWAPKAVAARCKWSSHHRGSGRYRGGSLSLRSRGWGLRANDLHGSPTAGASERGPRPEPGRSLRQVDLEQDVEQLDHPFAVGVKNAEVARAAEASGQDVAEQ